MDVLEIEQALVEIPGAIKRFRIEGAVAEPVIVGEGGRPEAVVLSFPLFERMASLVEDLEIAKTVRDRAAAGPATPLDPADYR